MIQSVAYTLFLGKPLIMYGGVLAFLLFVLAALIGILNLRGIAIISFKWHARVAIAALVIAAIHALFGLSTYFGF